jgi:diguanylate cyclase (GGDEF)-like protein/PAS domain S-box-containing protein
MSLDFVDPDRDVEFHAPDGAVEAEQIRLLLQNPVIVPANLINTGLVAVVVSPLYPASVVVIWLVLVCIVNLMRALLRRRYMHAASDARNSPFWLRLFTLHSLIAGCLWGCSASVILMTPDSTYYDFIVFALGGMMAGGVVVLAVNLRTMFAFILPTVLPAIVALAFRGGLVPIEMAVMLALFTCALAWVGRGLNRSFTENIRLRFGQDALVIQLRSSEAAMSASQTMAHVGSWAIDLQTKCDVWSAETYRIFGVDPAVFKPSLEALLRRTHPDDRKAVSDDYAALLATGKTHGIDHRIVMNDGGIRHVHELGEAIYGADGRPVQIVGTVQDVTERLQGEAASASLAAIVDASADAIYAQTETGTILSWNRGAEHLFGYRADEAIGLTIRLIIPEDRRHEIDRHLAALAKGQAVGSFDTERLRKDGTRVPVSIAASLTRDAAGAIIGASFITRDITERKIAADALAYRDRLSRAVTVGTGIVVKAQSLELGMPEALRAVGEAMRVDRVLVFQTRLTPPEQVRLRYHWEAPGILAPIETIPLAADDAAAATEAAWSALLHDNQPVIVQLATSEGSIREMLARFNSTSIVLIPIFVGGAYWGTLSADSCTTPRDWNAIEIDTLRAFADIAGALIQRAEAQHSLQLSEERFRSVTATAQDAIITIDGAARISLWNQAAERILGYTEEEALGQHAPEFLVPPRLQKSAAAQIEIFLATGAGEAIGKVTEMTALRKDGTEIAIELSLAAMPLGDRWGAIGVLRDVSRRKDAEEKLQFANLLLRTQMEASPDGILVVDEKMQNVSFNQRFGAIWNLPPADLLSGNDAPQLAKVASFMADKENFIERVRYLYDHPGEDSQEEFETTDGRSIDRYTVTLYSPSRAYLGRAWFFRDITERKRIEALALRMARFDVLTGLANRAVFVEALQHAIAAAKRGGRIFAVLSLDLDRFKDVNDTLGHPVGDELLKAVADRLRTNTRETDTVARFGGDEFAIIVADIRDATGAAVLADKLITSFAVPFPIRGSDIHTGVSIGIAIYGADAPDAEALLSHADVALYRAKAEGRDSYRFFTDAMDIEVQTRVRLGAELRHAVDQGQLFLMYQPQVAIDSGRITGMEALVRWRHPTRGVVEPALFIPIAEQIGIIAKLGHWVLWEACRQGRAWLDAGVAPARISVNVSALQFRAPVALEADIAAALTQTGLPPQMLELELTETVLLAASHEHSDLLLRLRETGVTVAIDDFGTGYSSLDYLRRYPSNRIKIAQNFVSNLETKPGDAAIIRATIGLARELKIDVIAEGVETHVQRDLLKAWGCGEVQGYLFAKPLTPEDALAALRDGKLSPSEPGTNQAGGV